MRRSSLITIILLVLIIIGLSVALVLTNLPQKTEVANGNEAVENMENTDSNKEVKEEKVSSLSLTDEKAVEMANLLTMFSHSNMFFEGNNIIQGKDVRNSEKIFASWLYYANGKNSGSQYVSRADIAEGVKRIFGDVEYKDEDIREYYIGLKFDSVNDRYEVIMGGGGPAPANISGIYKIDEYSNRYEVYVKYLSKIPTPIVDNNNVYNGELCTIHPRASIYSEVLGRYRENSHWDDGYPDIDTFISGITIKEFAEASNIFYNENDFKVLSKFYDEASEYKVTFMKNDDGSFYWLKTEVIK